MEQTKPKRTTLYLPPKLWAATKILAIKRGCDATDIVVTALEQYLNRKRKK